MASDQNQTTDPAPSVLLMLAKAICDKACVGVCDWCLNEARIEWESEDDE